MINALFFAILQLISINYVFSIPQSTPCDDPCVGGACLFKDCSQPVSCRGGACKFINCINPTCEGGACHFDGCLGSKCPGGGCDFFNTKETLKPGYCEGEGCKFEGRPHPSLREGHLTI